VIIQDRLRSFIVEDLQSEVPREKLTDDFALIDQQVIDSMGIYEIVSFIEDEYHIEVLDEELLPDNFETIAAIARLVEAKQAG
jgi:acyl carrier protein